MKKRYVKKPVVIEAVQWTGTRESMIEVMEFIDSPKEWAFDGAHLPIDTLEGRMVASVGDFIIKGVNGEFYPCKEDIFEKTYDFIFEHKVTGFNDYQNKAKSTANYPKTGGLNFAVYPVLGLTGEAGEVAEKFKKIIRDNDGLILATQKNEIKKELGDVLWYIANIAFDLGFTLEEVAQTNIDKLFSRKARGKIQGSGDNR